MLSTTGRKKSSARRASVSHKRLARKLRNVDWDRCVPPSKATRKRVFLTCHYCAYSPPEVPKNGICPKCGSHSWERYALSARLLAKISR